YWPLIRNGDVLDLKPYLDQPNWEKDSTWRDTFLPGSLDPYSENGKVYGIPLPYYVFCFWYNKKIFADHGWTTPTRWDELLALCEKIKAAGIPPIAFQGRYPYYAQAMYDHTFYHLAGPKGWRDRNDLVPGALSSPAAIESISLLRRLSKDYFQPGCMG